MVTMTELYKDKVGVAVVRALHPGDAGPDRDGEPHHQYNHHQCQRQQHQQLQHRQQPYFGVSRAVVEARKYNKPVVHWASLQNVDIMSTTTTTTRTTQSNNHCAAAVAVPPMYPDGVSPGELNTFPLGYGKVNNELTATGNGSFSGADDILKTYQAFPPGDVGEIEEFTSWMTDVAHNLTAINFEEPALFMSSANALVDRIGPSSCCSSAADSSHGLISFAKASPTRKHSQKEEQNADVANSDPPPPPVSSLSEANRKVKPGASSSSTSTTTTKASAADIVSSPAPKTLKPRVSKRPCKRVVDNFPKKLVTVEQLEHVRREKERRYYFSNRISALECLLPAAAHNFKRDRYSIVSDSVQYVKSLQQKVDDLKRTFLELKLNRSAKRPQQRSAGTPPRNGCTGTTTLKVHMAANEEGSKCFTHVVEYHIQVEGEVESAASLGKYRCRPDYMSGAMKVLEQLNLDVCRCTITKMSSYTICVIVAKPRLTSSHQVTTSAPVLTAIRSSLAVT